MPRSIRIRTSSRPGAISLGVLGALALGTLLAGQRPLEFEVASIKPNREGSSGTDTRLAPDGSYRSRNISVRNLLPLAWPTELPYQNLPDWAARDHYDVSVKPPPGASPPEIQEMWRALFRDRFKLQVHTEMRDSPIYALVVARADGRLGPRIRPSDHDCAALAKAAAAAPQATRPSPPSPEEVMATCGSLFLRDRMMTGGMLLSTYARGLSSSVGRIVEDRTGLTGYYAFTLNYAPAPRPGEPVPDSPDVSIFTALQEQLGLKLEPARKALQTVVIDHIEPPTEN